VSDPVSFLAMRNQESPKPRVNIWLIDKNQGESGSKRKAEISSSWWRSKEVRLSKEVIKAELWREEGEHRNEGESVQVSFVISHKRQEQ
jgi:hypothetical protein